MCTQMGHHFFYLIWVTIWRMNPLFTSVICDNFFSNDRKTKMVMEYSIPCNNDVSRSYRVMSLQIKHWYFLYFVNGDHHVFSQSKPHTWSERLKLMLRSFFKLESLGYTNNIGDLFNQHYLRKGLGTYWI